VVRRAVVLAAMVAFLASSVLATTVGGAATDARGDPLVSAAVASATRTISVAPFVVRWSPTNPEAITHLSWNGSANLTNTAGHPNCPDGGPSEFFGNSWGTGDGATFVAPVGWGSSGKWAPYGAGGVQAASAATGCYGTSGIPVRTSYGFFGGNPAVARIQVERSFDFGSTPFTTDLRPYIPRLSLANDYSQVLYPSIAASLVTRNGMDCHFGCPVLDWNGSWFAVHDPRTGRGMVVKHETSSAVADLWIDVDGASTSTSTSVVLRAPAGGFAGTLVDRQVLCFYDNSIWVPSMTPPTSCTKPWTDVPLGTGSKLGLPSTGGAYTATTKVSPIGGYVTWRANLGLAAAGKAIDVDVAVKRSNGTWTPFARLTGRMADPSGVATFAWRAASPKWISVRFRGAGLTSVGAQARWR
jgi:hypothetical protein